MKNYFRKSHLAIKFLLTLFLANLFYPTISDDKKALDYYLNKAADAIASENYHTAITTLEEAKKDYPENKEINILLADLYNQKELYELALAEYLKAEIIDPEDTSIIESIAWCYILLNKEKEAITYFKKHIALDPQTESSRDWLAWMYYKINQLDSAEQILLETCEQFGLTRRRAITLGSVYADKWEYKKSKDYYFQAINIALQEQNVYSASIAFYNMAILEKSFYNYREALHYTQESIDFYAQPSGHRMKGDILLESLDYKSAFNELNLALGEEDAAYTKLDLAYFFQECGKLEQALDLALELLHDKDLSWMYLYGMTKVQYYKWIYKLLADIYAGFAMEEYYKPRAGFLKEELAGIWQYICYQIESWYYREKYKMACIEMGKDYLAEKNDYYGFQELYNANKEYRDVALKYLYKAKEFIMAVTPKSLAWYLLEEGKVLNSIEHLEQAITLFDPFWEKSDIAEALRYLIPLLNSAEQQKKQREAINMLYELNPGGLIQYGIGLPLILSVKIAATDIEQYYIQIITDMLKKSGSQLAITAQQGFRFMLIIFWDKQNMVEFKLLDTEKNSTIRNGIIKVEPGFPFSQCEQVLNTILFEYIYSVDLQF